MTEKAQKYLLMFSLGAISIGLGLVLASQFVGPSYSQQGDIPAPPPSVGNSDFPAPPPSMNQGPNQMQPVEQAVNSPTPESDFELFLEPYNYDPSERRDPFLRVDLFDKDGSAVSVGERPLGPLLPLEQYDLDSIKLIGIIWNVEAPRAMFQDPTEKIHVLEKDQRIGRNQGYIAVIREGEVVVVETAEINGEPVYSTRVLRISK